MYNDKILVSVIFYFWIWMCITKNVQIKLINPFSIPNLNTGDEYGHWKSH